MTTNPMSHSVMKPCDETACVELETGGIAIDLNNTAISPTYNKNNTVESLEDSSITRGINPASMAEMLPKEVRFSDQVKVIKVPGIQVEKSANVTFSDRVVNIDTPTLKPVLDPHRKHVRFSCLKHPKQPLSHGLTLLQMLKRGTMGPMFNNPVSSKKQVRFGALKCQKPKLSNSTFGHLETECDEAETRRIFKRECMKHKAMLPSRSVDDGEGD